MTDSNVMRGEQVFCQMAGRDISRGACTQTQGQEGCFGCASPARMCEVCKENFVVVSATGTCSACTKKALDQEPGFSLKNVVAKFECKFMGKPISGAACWTTQGQEECQGCPSPARYCETCEKKHVRYPQYGLCFSCTVAEYGDGWHSELADQPVSREQDNNETESPPAEPTKSSTNFKEWETGIVNFLDWLQHEIPALDLKNANPEERILFMDALSAIDTIVDVVRSQVKKEMPWGFPSGPISKSRTRKPRRSNA